MIEYIYRGFKIAYNIEQKKDQDDFYKATGNATYLLNFPKTFAPTSFHTEYNHFASVEHEIRQRLEDHINAELKNFYDKKNM